jgi:hypothetical protein
MLDAELELRACRARAVKLARIALQLARRRPSR